MTTGIDHAAEARNHIERAENPNARKTLTYTGIAQAHAVLALVEQQRIANIIAYAADVDVIRAGNHDVNVLIRRALGLS